MLLLYPTIITTMWCCNKLHRFQTLSNILLYKFVCYIFFAVDIISRIFLVIHSNLTPSLSPHHKWVWAAIILWSTSFLVFLILLFMIRAESRKSYHYMAEVLAPSKRNVIYTQIRKLNVSCIMLAIYGTLSCFQFGIDFLGLLPAVIGLFNQWIVMNTILIACLLINLIPESQSEIEKEFHLRNLGDRTFRLLDAVDGH